MIDYRYQHLIRQDCPLPPGTHVIGYCRDSGGEEQERSVQQQVQTIEEYCARHGLILERAYVDEAKLSSNSEKRDQLNLMLSDIAARHKQIRHLDKRKAYMATHPFGLIVWKSNRLGRDSIETTYIKADLRIRGITIVSLLPTLETGDATIDALFEIVQQHQDEKLLQEISDNSRRGLTELVSLRDNDPSFLAHNPGWSSTGAYLGIMPGPKPTGFKGERILIGIRDRKGRAQGGEKHYVERMIPDPELWERCYLAWKMRIEDSAGIKAILDATRLFESVSGYNHFFENRIYAGDLVYGGKVYENFVPALIPRDWWEEEQRRRAERLAKREKRAMQPRYEPRRIASRHLLSGLVFCGAIDGAEHPMHADTVPAREGKRSRWDFYICTRKKNSRDNQCQSGRVGAAALDQAVIDRLMADVLTKENLRPIADALANNLSERNEDVSVRINAVQSQLDEVQKSIQQLLNAIEQVGVSASIQARLREREAEAQRLVTELVHLEDLFVAPTDVVAVSEQQLDAWIESIRAALDGDDVEIARRAIQQFVGKIVVNGKAGTLYYTFPLSDLSRRDGMTLTGLEPVFSP